MEEEGVGGGVEIGGAAEDLGVDLFELDEGGSGSGGGGGGGGSIGFGGVGREG